MKHSLPILPAIAGGVLVSVTAGFLAAQGGSDAEPAEPLTATTAPAAVPPAAATIMVESAARLAQQRSIVALIRFQTDLYGQKLAGTGRYLQGTAESRFSRLELKMKLGEDTSSVLQVCDGDSIWIRRRTTAPATLGQVDVRRLLAAQEQPAAKGTPASAQLSPTLPLGGLPRLLANLDRAFTFTSVRPARLGRLPVWVASGGWKADLLAELMPRQKEAILAGQAPEWRQLPVHVPDRVLVYLGQDDLFPYKFEYLRGAASAADDASARIIASLKLYEVQFNSTIDRLEFTYQPGDVTPVDETEKFIQQMLPGA